PPMTGNYMPSGPDREVDDSMFTYGPKQSKTSESNTQTSNFDSCKSNSSAETLESVPEPVVVEPKVDDPQKALKNKGIVDSGCSRHMTRNKAYLVEYQDDNGGPVSFGEGNKESTRKRPGKRLKMKATKKSRIQKIDSNLEEEEHLKTFVKLVPDEKGILDYEVLEKRFSIINWESKFYHLDRHGAECIYYRIFRSDESSRWIKTFSKMVTMFDRLDLEELYNLVMHRVHTLTLEDGTEIHMLVERKYPLIKETLERMMSLKLIAKSASESAYNLLRLEAKEFQVYRVTKEFKKEQIKE
ncbi:hypothetical protein Tco_1048617, partial [Tanacetum coccineum]